MFPNSVCSFLGPQSREYRILGSPRNFLFLLRNLGLHTSPTVHVLLQETYTKWDQHFGKVYVRLRVPEILEGAPSLSTRILFSSSIRVNIGSMVGCKREGQRGCLLTAMGTYWFQ